MEHSKNKYHLVFVGKPRCQFEATQVKKGLLTLCSGNLGQARDLYRLSPKVIFTSETKSQVQRMLNRVWKSGWHASIQLGEKCVYSTEQVEASRDVDRAGSNASGIIPQIKTANRDIQKNTRRIHSPESDISVRVPQDWKVLDNLNSGAVLQAGCHERQVFLIVIKQYKHTFGAVLPLRDYAIATCQAALGWVADAKLTREPTHLPLGNYYLAEMEGLVGGSIVKYQITTHESAKVFYALYAWSTLDNYPAVCHELKQVSASLKVNLTAPVAQLSPA